MIQQLKQNQTKSINSFIKSCHQKRKELEDAQSTGEGQEIDNDFVNIDESYVDFNNSNKSTGNIVKEFPNLSGFVDTGDEVDQLHNINHSDYEVMEGESGTLIHYKNFLINNWKNCQVFTRQKRVALQLLQILERANSPLYLYDEIIRWIKDEIDGGLVGELEGMNFNEGTLPSRINTYRTIDSTL